VNLEKKKNQKENTFWCYFVALER